MQPVHICTSSRSTCTAHNLVRAQNISTSTSFIECRRPEAHYDTTKDACACTRSRHLMLTCARPLCRAVPSEKETPVKEPISCRLTCRSRWTLHYWWPAGQSCCPWAGRSCPVYTPHLWTGTACHPGAAQQHEHKDGTSHCIASHHTTAKCKAAMPKLLQVLSLCHCLAETRLCCMCTRCRAVLFHSSSSHCCCCCYRQGQEFGIMFGTLNSKALHLLGKLLCMHTDS